MYLRLTENKMKCLYFTNQTPHSFLENILVLTAQNNNDIKCQSNPKLPLPLAISQYSSFLQNLATSNLNISLLTHAVYLYFHSVTEPNKKLKQQGVSAGISHSFIHFYTVTFNFY